MGDTYVWLIGGGGGFTAHEFRCVFFWAPHLVTASVGLLVGVGFKVR